MMVVVEIDYDRKQVDFEPSLQRKAFNTEANKREEELKVARLDKAKLLCRFY